MSMNKLEGRQQLLVITMEECGELIQACSKALRKQDLFGQQNLKDEIGDVYTMINLLVEHDVVSWTDLEERVNYKKIKLKQYQDQLNTERILLTPELIKDRELEIQDFASEIVNLQEKRFGPRGDMIIQRSKLMQPVQDQVLTVVKQIAEEKKYDFIFDRSSSVTMLYSAKIYDISYLVIKRINRQQRIQNRKSQIEKLKSKTSSLNN